MTVQKNNPISFENSVIRVISFLDKEKIDYFLLGGIAASVMGEPRFTYDLDLDMFIDIKQVGVFLKKAKAASFIVNEKISLENVKTFGTFRLCYHKLQVDFILASTELEKSALNRRQSLQLFGKKMWFPSSEDLILLKVIAGREKDVMDARSIVIRNKKSLDIPYLQKWSRRISEEAENYKILHLIEKILR